MRVYAADYSFIMLYIYIYYIYIYNHLYSLLTLSHLFLFFIFFIQALELDRKTLPEQWRKRNARQIIRIPLEMY